MTKSQVLQHSLFHQLVYTKLEHTFRLLTMCTLDYISLYICLRRTIQSIRFVKFLYMYTSKNQLMKLTLRHTVYTTPRFESMNNTQPHSLYIPG